MNKDYLTVTNWTPAPTPELEYVAGAPSLDPAFRQLRRKHFDKAGTWAELKAGKGSLFVARSPMKIGPIACRGLLPAFGWETRPYDRPELLDEALCMEVAAQARARDDWDVLQLTSLLPAEAERLARAAGTQGIGAQTGPFSVRVIPGGISYEQYMAPRSPSTVREWKRTLRKATKKGIEYSYDLAWRDILALFDVKQIASANGEDYTKTPVFLEFFDEFRTEMKRQGRMLEVGVLHEGRLVGFDLGFWRGKVLHAYQTAYHPAYRDDRPGALVFERIIELGLNQGASLINFMGDYPYMTHYSKTLLDLRKLTLFAPTARGRAAHGLLRLKGLLGR
ncbi:MAG TPA: GNAT family N-acetyltransferase [Bdellovibrionota bacterium]|nr:GNAT family N-acetyltransferase [Bdellovibrionota bacterium]